MKPYISQVYLHKYKPNTVDCNLYLSFRVVNIYTTDNLCSEYIKKLQKKTKFKIMPDGYEIKLIFEISV